MCQFIENTLFVTRFYCTPKFPEKILKLNAQVLVYLVSKKEANQRGRQILKHIPEDCKFN